jgi:hypothetical protein
MTDEELQLRMAEPNLSPAELRSLLRIVREKHAAYPPGKVGWAPELHTLEHRLAEPVR